MKKFLSFLLIALISIASVMPIMAESVELPFIDVPSDAWYYPEVLYVYENGIMQGKEDDVFAPSAVMTRAELVTLLSRLASADLSGMNSAAAEQFSDVSVEDWYASYVGWGASVGIVNGYSDGTFGPNASVTRQELAVMIMRYIRYDRVVFRGDRSVVDCFSDVERVAEWAEDDVEKLRLTGIVGGDTDGNFNPEKSASRAEIARIAAMLKKFTDSLEVGEIEGDPIPGNLGILLNHESGLKLSNAIQLMAGGNEVNSTSTGTHGGHESKLLRTKYGTFAVYLVGENGGYDVFNVARITDNGVEVLFEDSYPHSNGSCLPNIFAGEDGTVFVSVISVCSVNYTEGAYLTIYEIDPKTGEYTENHSTPTFKITGVHGYGYSQPIPDLANGKIYALYTGGDVPGYLAWFIYDIEDGKWSSVCHTVKNDWRCAYFNAYADGEGGFYFVGQRDVLTSSLGQHFGFNFSTSGYIWDALYLFNVPDADKEEYTVKTVFEPEYFPDEKGEANPQSTSHYGDGCSYLDREGRLHVLYTNREKSKHDIYHAVYDEELNVIKNDRISLSNKRNRYTLAMAQGTDGAYYIFAIDGYGGTDGAMLEVWSSSDGLDYKMLLAPTEITTGGDSPVSFDGGDIKLIPTSPRNNSLEDGKVGFLFAQSGNKQYYFSVELP